MTNVPEKKERKTFAKLIQETVDENLKNINRFFIFLFFLDKTKVIMSLCEKK